MTDNVNNPPHYTSSDAQCSRCGKTIECIDVTRHMDFNIGNAMKYLWRYKDKNGIEDLQKAVWYINDAILNLDNNPVTKNPTLSGCYPFPNPTTLPDPTDGYSL